MNEDLDKIIRKIEIYRKITSLSACLMIFTFIPIGLAFSEITTSLLPTCIALSISLAFLILGIVMAAKIDREIADLKDKYKQLKIRDKSYCDDLLFIAPNTIFLQGPDCGETVIIIAILDADYTINPVVKARKVIKEEAEKIYF